MFRSGLVPRRFAQFGIAAGSLALVTAILVLFGAYEQVSGPSTILTLGDLGAVAGHLSHRQGFRPGASLFQCERRDTGADEFASRVGESAAPASAKSAGA